jgi:choline dehydrogenase-like flavoprotein
MTQTKHYDVIIIGTGAGGGTLVHALASSGKNILLIERGDYVRLKRPTGTRAPSTSKENTRPRKNGATRTANRFIRTLTTTSAETRSFTARPCSVYEKKTLAKSATLADSPPPGLFRMTISNRTT